MSKLRRYYSTGNVYFITVVTYKRMPSLVKNINLLWQSIEKAKGQNSFNIIAWAILPDHFHVIINPHDSNLSEIVKRIKLIFSAKIRIRDNDDWGITNIVKIEGDFGE